MIIPNFKFSIRNLQFSLITNPYSLNPNHGFTFIEIIIVTAVILILLGFSTLNLLNFQQRSFLNSTQVSAISDIKLQQLKAMNNETLDGIVEPYGIYFGTNTYTLFKGATYSAEDPSNFSVQLPDGLTFTNVEFADSQIVFQKGNGEIANFTPGNDSITISHEDSGEIQSLTFNKLGVITELYEVRN